MKNLVNIFYDSRLQETFDIFSINMKVQETFDRNEFQMLNVVSYYENSFIY